MEVISEQLLRGLDTPQDRTPNLIDIHHISDRNSNNIPNIRHNSLILSSQTPARPRCLRPRTLNVISATNIRSTLEIVHRIAHT